MGNHSLMMDTHRWVCVKPKMVREHQDHANQEDMGMCNQELREGAHIIRMT